MARIAGIDLDAYKRPVGRRSMKTNGSIKRAI